MRERGTWLFLGRRGSTHDGGESPEFIQQLLQEYRLVVFLIGCAVQQRDGPMTRQPREFYQSGFLIGIHEFRAITFTKLGPLGTIMSEPLRQSPRLPITVPAGKSWQVSIIGVIGRYAVSHRRPGGGRPLYPNEVVEKEFEVSATTRNWTTMIRICEILRGE